MTTSSFFFFSSSKKRVWSILFIQGLWWRWSTWNRQQRRERMGLSRRSSPTSPFPLRRCRQQKLPRHRWGRQGILISLCIFSFRCYKSCVSFKISSFLVGWWLLGWCSCSLGVGTKGAHLVIQLRVSLRTRLRTFPARSRLFPVLRLSRYTSIHSFILFSSLQFMIIILFGVLILWILMLNNLWLLGGYWGMALFGCWWSGQSLCLGYYSIIHFTPHHKSFLLPFLHHVVVLIIFIIVIIIIFLLSLLLLLLLLFFFLLFCDQ